MVRLKHRYLLINILYPEETASPPSSTAFSSNEVADILDFRRPSSDKLTPQLLARVIRDQVTELFGDYGSGVIAASLVVKYLSPATSTAIIRVSRAHYRLVWAALSFVKSLPRPVEQKCVVQVVRVSGTIRKAEEEAIRRAKAAIVRARGKDKGDVALGKMLGMAKGEKQQQQQVRGIVSDDEDEDEMDEGL